MSDTTKKSALNLEHYLASKVVYVFVWGIILGCSCVLFLISGITSVLLGLLSSSSSPAFIVFISMCSTAFIVVIVFLILIALGIADIDWVLTKYGCETSSYLAPYVRSCKNLAIVCLALYFFLYPVSLVLMFILMFRTTAIYRIYIQGDLFTKNSFDYLNEELEKILESAK